MWVLTILCLLLARHHGVRFLYNKYLDYAAWILYMPGLVVVDVIGHYL